MNIVESWEVDSSWSLILDRKSAINKSKASYKIIAALSRLFSRTIFMTNQPEIEAELISHNDLLKEHNHVAQLVEYFGGYIDAFYYDINDPNFDTFSSKPNPGMAYQAKGDFPDIDFRKSIKIGSELVDIQFASSLKMKSIWLDKQHGKIERHEIM